MLLSRANLAVLGAAASDRGRYALNGVLVDPDGTTVASDGAMLIACEGTGAYVDAASAPDCMKGAHVPADGLILPAELCADALRNIPKRTYNNPFHTLVGMSAVEQLHDVAGHDVHRVELTTTDGERTKRVDMASVPGQFPNYSEVVPNPHTRAPVARFALGMGTLLRMIDTLRKMGATDALDVEVYGPKTPVVFRTTLDNAQHVAAVVWPVVHEGNDGEVTLPELTYWDRHLATPADELRKRCTAALEAIVQAADKRLTGLEGKVHAVELCEAPGAADAHAEIARLAGMPAPCAGATPDGWAEIDAGATA